MENHRTDRSRQVPPGGACPLLVLRTSCRAAGPCSGPARPATCRPPLGSAERAPQRQTEKKTVFSTNPSGPINEVNWRSTTAPRWETIGSSRERCMRGKGAISVRLGFVVQNSCRTSLEKGPFFLVRVRVCLSFEGGNSTCFPCTVWVRSRSGLLSDAGAGGEPPSDRNQFVAWNPQQDTLKRIEQTKTTTTNQPNQTKPMQTTPNQSKPTKANQTKAKQPKPKQTKPKQSNPNQTTPNQTNQPNQTQPTNQTKPKRSKAKRCKPKQSKAKQTNQPTNQANQPPNQTNKQPNKQTHKQPNNQAHTHTDLHFSGYLSQCLVVSDDDRCSA